MAKIIGLCGYPLHGKTSAQLFLSHLGVSARDDSAPLRRAAMDAFGLSWDDVSTQEGKAKLITVSGKQITIREAIGRLGERYEGEFGPNYWIERAIAEQADAPAVSFGSVRMNQGLAIKSRGGFVIQICDPRRPRSEFQFDQFVRENVDRVVINDGDLSLLAARVTVVTANYLELSLEQLAAGTRNMIEAIPHVA